MITNRSWELSMYPYLCLNFFFLQVLVVIIVGRKRGQDSLASDLKLGGNGAERCGIRASIQKGVLMIF